MHDGLMRCFEWTGPRNGSEILSVITRGVQRARGEKISICSPVRERAAAAQSQPNKSLRGRTLLLRGVFAIIACHQVRPGNLILQPITIVAHSLQREKIIIILVHKEEFSQVCIYIKTKKKNDSFSIAHGATKTIKQV